MMFLSDAADRQKNVPWPCDHDVVAAAAGLIKPFEGLKPRAYICPAGKWAIGYGSRRYPDGRAVRKGDGPLTEEKASACLDALLAVTWQDFRKLLIRVPNVHQAGALLSLAYNVGTGAHDGGKGDLAGSDLLDAYNRGDDLRVAWEFRFWNQARIYGKDTALPGLKKRRKAERAFYLQA